MFISLIRFYIIYVTDLFLSTPKRFSILLRFFFFYSDAYGLKGRDTTIALDNTRIARKKYSSAIPEFTILLPP